MAKKKLGSNVANKIRQVNVNGTIYDVQDPDLEVELPKKLDKPENPTAGNAIVYDGTNWAKQDGYGYTDGSSVVHKIDTKYIPVSANPASPTTDLTGVQIGETKYRIKGMQDGTSAGDALVWTGSTWEVQDGYGYTEAGSQTTIDWDGDTTSKDTFNVEIAGNQFSFYKVGSYVSSLPNTASVTFNSVQNTVNKYDGTGGCAFIAEEDGPMVFNVHAGNFSITFIESVVLTGTAPSDGLYLLKIGDLYVSSFTYGAPAVVHQINSKYIPHDTTKADLTRVEAIEGKIPNQATSENQLADKAFVNSSINAVAAYYITSNADGDAFASHAALVAGPWYYAGATRVPTKNDYAIVLEDETQKIAASEFVQFTTTDDYIGYYVLHESVYKLVTLANKDSLGITPGTTEAWLLPTTRYTYTKAEGTETGSWAFQYVINNAPLTAAQVAAINSGITSSGVTKLNGIETGATKVIESTVSDWGFTKNAGTITGITMNGASKGTSGVVDLGTVLTSHQSLDAYRTSANQDTIDTGLSDRITTAQSTAESKSDVSANPTTTTDTLTGLTIDGTSYKISAGLPDGTAASQGLVWDGTQWVKQAGYAYESSGTINPMKGTLLTYTGTTAPEGASVGDFWIDESETSVSEVIDTTPTQGSNNLVTSGGVYTFANGKESVSNKVTTISATSTDDEYPSAKAVYNFMQTSVQSAIGGSY